MDVAQIKIEKDLEMQPPPGFTEKASNAQGKCTGANDCDNIRSGLKGNLEGTEYLLKPSTNNGKDNRSINTEDKKADTSNSNAEEVAEDEDYYEQEPEPVDTDFYDFDKCKREECFESGHIWAIFGDFDVMPRLYARINAVYPPYKVNVTWLEFVAGNTDETAWEISGLPVACGKFKLGKTSITIEDADSFSHKIWGEKDVRKSYNIYPRKGETWALYKNWNTNWSSDPDNHREYEYEFVVVLSDYTNISGILVAHLVKLKGFICLFRPTKNNAMVSYQIPSNEMLRFSHKVPSFRTNGKEREDVPEGYFELDPRCLPNYLEEVSGFIDMEAETIDDNINGSLKAVSKEKHPMHHKGKEDASISKEDKRADSSNRIAEEVSKQQPVVSFFDNPDFYDFDRDKSEECFAVDQMWAMFDDLDGMPRFYARINKVHSPFKVDITWLDFVAEDIDETAWKRSGLPVACGKFKYQKTDTTDDIRSFSHKIFCKRSVDKSYNIYPQKGETWALYKNWNLKWSSDPDNHSEYDYEFVVVMSDYTYKSGISVAYLVKLKGFVCLFKPTKKNGMASFQIPSNEMLRFSHRIPSFRTNGKEREDVPEGYFELDNCNLPSNLEEMSETVDGNMNGSLKSVLKEKQPMPMKRKTPNVESTLDGSSPGKNKSFRISNGCYENLNEEKYAADASGRSLDKKKATSVSDSEKNACPHAKEMSPDGVITIVRSADKDISSSPSSLKIFDMLDTGFCNFKIERSCERFKTGQIWALYSELDKLPKTYARIQSVQSFPVFRLAIKWLKSCDPPRDIISWVDKEMPVSCGTFKVTSSEVVVFNDSILFSHQLSEVPAVNNCWVQ
ncbi:uncharacterized protein LOC113309264 [Papaver somniferum]|uniref:uncharacterized protein LOC113309264 n=1 Tax=Papaver somniferum TaxID=3469 RepID=UPI000E7031A1|nr:uncharacterized protein LOC113309264 [Papaver somniferum]XP_026413469.1 uncharacterized protein LOC113309264 [Papaver somniferum]